MYKGQVQVSEQQLPSFVDSVDQLKIQGKSNLYATHKFQKNKDNKLFENI